MGKRRSVLPLLVVGASFVGRRTTIERSDGARAHWMIEFLKKS